MDTPSPASPQTSQNNAVRSPIDEVLRRKPEGYHKLAETIMGPYPELTIVRRFRALNALSLLSLQAELTQLEFELKLVSQQDDESADTSIQNLSSSFEAQLGRTEAARPQWDSIVKMRAKLKEYSI